MTHTLGSSLSPAHLSEWIGAESFGGLKIFVGDLAPDFAAQRYLRHTHPSQHDHLYLGTADAPGSIAFGTELVGKIDVDRPWI